jgi:hypothetical protein
VNNLMTSSTHQWGVDEDADDAELNRAIGGYMDDLYFKQHFSPKECLEKLVEHVRQLVLDLHSNNPDHVTLLEMDAWVEAMRGVDMDSYFAQRRRARRRIEMRHV